MGVSGQSEGSGGVSQILLDRLDIVTGLQAVDRKRVPQIMEAKLRHPGVCGDQFSIPANHFPERGAVLPDHPRPAKDT